MNEIKRKLVHLHHCRGASWNSIFSILKKDPEMLARMFRRVMTTPFQSAVAPDVKMISAVSSGEIVSGAWSPGRAALRRQAAGPRGSRSSVPFRSSRDRPPLRRAPRAHRRCRRRARGRLRRRGNRSARAPTRSAGIPRRRRSIRAGSRPNRDGVSPPMPRAASRAANARAAAATSA